jgi:aryl-alcohol dehydrogenase-like predicted oxidoreductase
LPAPSSSTANSPGEPRALRPQPAAQPRFQQDALHANLAIVGRVRKLAERLGATPARVALAWVLAQGWHVVPIPGTKTPKYLADNAGAADIELSAADLAELDTLPAPEGTRY